MDAFIQTATWEITSANLFRVAKGLLPGGIEHSSAS
jgi:hypothetical protein